MTIWRRLRLCDQISDEFPRDLVIVKTHQYLIQPRQFAGNVRVALKAAEANARRSLPAWDDGVAYEQCHLLKEAELEAWSPSRCGARSRGRSMRWRTCS